jgi:hypothetical protein
MVEIIQPTQQFLIASDCQNEANIIAWMIFGHIVRHPDRLTSQGRMCRSPWMQDGANCGGTGYIVGKDKETVLPWNDAETVAFAKTEIKINQ